MRLLRSNFSGGYHGTARQELGMPDNALVSPSTNLMYDGDGRLVNYKGTTSITGVLTDAPFLMYNVNDGYGFLGDGLAGSLFSGISRTLFSIGHGFVYYNASSLGFSASSTLQLTLWTGGAYGSTYQAGLAQPSAPTIAARTPDAGFSGKNSGSVSVKITRIRSATGAESIASPASNVIATDKQSLRVTFPAASTGQDKWGVYATQAGFGSTGPYYLLAEYTEAAVVAGTIDSVARSLQIEWADGDVLATLAPIDNYPPPAGIFACALNDLVCVVGCYGDTSLGVSASTPGTAIAVSLPGYPEAFPPDNLLFLPGPPTAVISRASDGYAYIAGQDYLCALTYTGGTPGVVLQEKWSNTGVRQQYNLCIVNGVLYAFINGKGLVRIGVGEEPETAFAAPIAGDIATWDPDNTTLGHDAANQQLVIMRFGVAYAMSLQTEKWSAALTSPDFLRSYTAVTVGGNLYIGGHNAAIEDRVFQFNNGTGTAYEAYTQFTDAGTMESKRVQEIQLAARVAAAGDTVKCDILGGRRAMSTTSQRQWSFPTSTSGAQHFRAMKPNVGNLKSLAVKVSTTATGLNQAPIAVEVYGDVEGVTL